MTSPTPRALTVAQRRALLQIRNRAHGKYRGNAPRGFCVATDALKRMGLIVSIVLHPYLPEDWELTIDGIAALEGP